MSTSATLSRVGPLTKRWPKLLGRMFSGEGVNDTVVTAVRLSASPEVVWAQLLTYEEVPVRPPFMLRTLLPYPLRSEGDKGRLGADIQCIYREGDLVKSITAVDPPRLLSFDVHEQRLGVESCVRAMGGSYEIRACGDQTEVVLTTRYVAYLRPRGLWRPVEQFLGHIFHRHILNGMRASLPCKI